MKKYKITVLVLFVIGFVLMIGSALISKQNLKHDKRSNTECLTDQRVFDYADKLTSSEEKSLEDVIAEYEDKIGADIVVVTINNEQAQDMFDTYWADTYYAEFEAIKAVATAMCDQNRFGWENWEYDPSSNRSTSDGYVPSDSIVIAANYEAGDVWMSTSGTRVRARISDSKASSLTEAGGKYLRSCITVVYICSGYSMCSSLLYHQYVKEGGQGYNYIKYICKWKCRASGSS